MNRDVDGLLPAVEGKLWLGVQQRHTDGDETGIGAGEDDRPGIQGAYETVAVFQLLRGGIAGMLSSTRR